MEPVEKMDIANLRTMVAELVYRSCMMLDAMDFNAYLAVCDEKFHYLITAFSPEIRREMTWLEHDKTGMALLFKTLPKHNSDRSILSRHATVYTISFSNGGKHADVVTAIEIYRTTLDGGATELFAVGKMHDKVVLSADGPLLLERQIKLDTRMLGIGFHIPF